MQLVVSLRSLLLIDLLSKSIALADSIHKSGNILLDIHVHDSPELGEGIVGHSLDGFVIVDVQIELFHQSHHNHKYLTPDNGQADLGEEESGLLQLLQAYQSRTLFLLLHLIKDMILKVQVSNDTESNEFAVEVVLIDALQGGQTGTNGVSSTETTVLKAETAQH